MKNEGYYIPSTNRKVVNPNHILDTKNSNMYKYSTFTENVKLHLLTEALNSIMVKCTKEDCNPGSSYSKVLCEQFIIEEGCDKLLNKFKVSTLLLAQIEQCVMEAYDEIIGKTDKNNPLSFTIDNSSERKFYDSLCNVSVDSASAKINKRVCDAAEDFIQRNINTKLDIEEVAAKTKERIDNAKAKYDDRLANQIQEEQMKIYKHTSDSLKTPTVSNIYEQFMKRTSKCILENEDMKSQFLDESGRFDLSKVENKIRVMYTFLEMVNSLKIKKVDNIYIEEVLSSIK